MGRDIWGSSPAQVEQLHQNHLGSFVPEFLRTHSQNVQFNQSGWDPGICLLKASGRFGPSVGYRKPQTRSHCLFLPVRAGVLWGPRGISCLDKFLTEARSFTVAAKALSSHNSQGWSYPLYSPHLWMGSVSRSGWGGGVGRACCDTGSRGPAVHGFREAKEEPEKRKKGAFRPFLKKSPVV